MTREEAIQELEETNTILKSWGGFTEYPQALYIAIAMAIEALKDRPQGEWIDVKNEPYCECSVCGAYIDNLDDDYAFCPRCGAKIHKGGDTE